MTDTCGRPAAWGLLVLTLLVLPACDEGPAPAPGPASAAAQASDVASDDAVPAPTGTECLADGDCEDGRWCADGFCRECDLAEDCDDGVACTTDGCTAEGRCEHAVVDGCCAEDATPEELAQSCGSPPAGVAPEDFWECTATGECAVQRAMSPVPVGLVIDPRRAAGAGAAGAEPRPAAGAPLSLPGEEIGISEAAWPDDGWFEAVACSGCLNPGGMNKRVNGSKCSSDAFCLSGWCQDGLCSAVGGVGSGCDWPDECTSGFCANGYCCSSACDGACDHCGLDGQEGSCGNGCRLASWRSEVQSAAVYEVAGPQDLVVLANLGSHPGGRTVPGGSDTHIVDWGLINWFCDGGLGGAAEVCDNLDNDCDGETDEDWKVGPAALGQPCTVGLGACAASGYWVCPVGGTGAAPVCSALTFDAGAETCNGLDDDCDGDTDEALVQACDTICGPGTETCEVGAWVGCTAPAPSDYPLYGQPCDGADSDQCKNGLYGCTPTSGFTCLEDPSGGLVETCATPEDDDCDGTANEEGATGCTPYYLDADNDGYGTGAPLCLCGPTGTHRALQDGDCNDADPTTYPGAPEPCNGVDNDCDGLPDDREPNGALGVPSFANGATKPGHPCLGVTSIGGLNCDNSSCFCDDLPGTWSCFVD